jgi:YopX protein
MNTNIFYKAWDKAGGEVMLDVYAIDFYNYKIQFKLEKEDGEEDCDMWRCYDDTDDLILLQNTRKQDVNGVNIFESDILKRVDCTGKESLGILKTDDMTWWLEDIETKTEWRMTVQDCDRVEVVGNAYRLKIL